ncbi:uncharacterized protein [Haliotis asinina]|uniref:uncharacterized protein n=1 Tax=Haliotis asinina TaxID=109174 RepID=UPI00353259A0
MFGLVAILLYFPALCFSFALFPNHGHETQRRQTPVQNMVNASSSEGHAELCLRLIRPCFDVVRSKRPRRSPQNIVVDGRLTVPCESNALEESRNCIDAASVCSDLDFYKASLRSLTSLYFICQNSRAFVAGEKCWDNPGSLPMFSTCISSKNICSAPTCVRNSVTMMPNCSTQDAILVSRMAAAVTKEVYGC